MYWYFVVLFPFAQASLVCSLGTMMIVIPNMIAIIITAKLSFLTGRVVDVVMDGNHATTTIKEKAKEISEFFAGQHRRIENTANGIAKFYTQSSFFSCSGSLLLLDTSYHCPKKIEWTYGITFMFP